MSQNVIVLAAAHRFPVGVILAMAAETLEDLQSRHGEILARLDEIEGLDEPSEDETTELAAMLAEAERINTQIATKQRIAALRPQPAGRRTAPEPQNRGEQPQGQRPGNKVEPRPKQHDPKAGFKNFGEFARTVRAAGGDAPSHEAAQRLRNALTTYGNEGTGADGGFLVPPDFRREMAVKVMGEESLLSRTDRMTSASNTIVVPKDETTPYGTSGVQAYWLEEAAQKIQSKPLFSQNTMRLNKLAALVPVTDEMLEDAPMLDSYLRSRVPDVFTAKINTAILTGTGVGMPLGLMKSPSLITVPKENAQAADSVVFQNIVNMYARMRASSVSRAVWLVNQTVLPQLMSMQFPGSGTAVPVFLPPGGLSTAPYGTLMGRPIVPIEAAALVGDVGDIIFADLSQYMTATKGEDIKTDVSIHLFFDYDVTTFRFVFRVTGMPWWQSAITPQQPGAPTQGHFIALADRA